MRRVGIDIQNIITNTVVEKGYETNVAMIKNVFTKKKTQRRKANINVRDNSWKVIGAWR